MIQTLAELHQRRFNNGACCFLAFDIQHLKDENMDNPHRLASVGRRKCLAEYGEQSSSIIEMLLVPRISQELTK